MGRTKESTVCFHPTDVLSDYNNCWGEDHKDAKILILGTDPTALDKRKLLVKNIQYPFGLKSCEKDKNFSKNPYFRSTYYNLAELLAEGMDIDRFIMEKVIVMNAVDKLLYDTEKKRYITTGECFQTNENREKWIEEFQKQGTIERIQEFPNVKLVVLTSWYLLWCLESERNKLNRNYKLSEHLCEKRKDWGKDIIVLSRHYKYRLSEDEEYKNWIIKNYKSFYNMYA